MSIRLEMLNAACGAARVLGVAVERIGEFARSCFNSDGGVKNRAGASDLYYTVFGLETLNVLGIEPSKERVSAYLEHFGDGEGLDAVHLASLIRCWAALGEFGASSPDLGKDTFLSAHADRMLGRMEHYRSEDGGYGATTGMRAGTIYHSFIALAAYQDCGREPPERERLAECIASLRTPDGGYANERGIPIGTTPTTAAAAVLLRELGKSVPSEATEWLLRCCREEGGFAATPGAPLPDLLSTATALHALAALGAPLEAVREPCLDFVDSLWTGRAFCGSATDRVEDIEYTFYALLALGHLGW